MTDTFDAEPEDSWDVGDTLDELVDNLIRRAVLLEPDIDIPLGNPRRTLDVLLELIERVRLRRFLAGRELVRANELEEDIDYVITARLS